MMVMVPNPLRGSMPLKIEEAELDRHSRAVHAVRNWASLVDVFLTIDDAVNIVNCVVKAWRSDNSTEALRDVSQASERMKLYSFGGDE